MKMALGKVAIFVILDMMEVFTGFVNVTVENCISYSSRVINYEHIILITENPYKQ